MILVGGGQLDPNIGRILRRILARDLEFVDLLVGPDSLPAISIGLDGKLEIDGTPVNPSGCFVRHDVFHAEKTGRIEDQRSALNWFHAVKGWALGRRDIRLLNREAAGAEHNKYYNLLRARAIGLDVPKTRLSNLAPGAGDGDWIRKPAAGGELTRLHDATTRRLAYPHFFQPKLERPELRIYRAGDRFFAFELESPDLDYREFQNTELSPVPMPRALEAPLRELCLELRLEFAAADFMRDANGDWLFLEINSQPMFAAFDRCVDGALCDAMIDWLVDHREADQG